MNLCRKDTAVYLGMLVAAITLVSAIVGPQMSQGTTNDLRHDAEIAELRIDSKKLEKQVAENNIPEFKKMVIDGFLDLKTTLKEMRTDDSIFRKEVKDELASQRILICQISNGKC